MLKKATYTLFLLGIIKLFFFIASLYPVQFIYPVAAIADSKVYCIQQESAASTGGNRSQSSNDASEKTTEFDEEIATLQAKGELSKAERRRLKKLVRRRLAA